MAKSKTQVSTTEDNSITTPSADMVTLSRAQLAEMIAEALQARDEDEPTGPPPGMELAKAIGAEIVAGLNANNPKKVTYGAFLKRPTAKHPLGPVMGPKLSRTYFQNGRLITYDSVTDEQILLLNRITHSGRYIDRKVEVIVRDEGGSGQSVEFRYSNASIDQRMELKSLFRNFTDLLQQIVAAQDEERAEDERNPRRVVTRRPFGSSKETIAAETAAALAGA